MVPDRPAHRSSVVDLSVRVTVLPAFCFVGPPAITPGGVLSVVSGQPFAVRAETPGQESDESATPSPSLSAGWRVGGAFVVDTRTERQLDTAEEFPARLVALAVKTWTPSSRPVT